MFYELAAQTWGEEEKQAIYDVVESGMLTMGRRVAAFEAEFARYFGRRYAVMVNSGSSANLVSVAALCYRKERPLKPGDEVIVPAISWATTYHPLQQYGLKLRFVDVELDSLNMDCSQLEAALTPNTRMIVGVSILGNPAALDRLRAFADAHDLIFFEDNCESMDAELGGRKTGTFGDIGTFSFFFSHHISTVEGGMVLTDDPELYALLRSIRNHGWTRDVPEDAGLFTPSNDRFSEAYRFILPGYNVRSTDINAAIGQVQLKKLPAMTQGRRANWQYFQASFADHPHFLIQRENGQSSAFSFTLILRPEIDRPRQQVLDALKKADIGYRMITGGNFLRHDVIRHYDYSTVGDAVNADLAHDRGFFVGNHPFDLRPQIDRLREVLATAI